MTPSRYDIYTRENGRWSRGESFEGERQTEAMAAAAALDAGGGNDGVRVMAVTEYGGDRPPLETLHWISPHLSQVASVQRQMKSAAAQARRAVAGEDPAPAAPEAMQSPSTPPMETPTTTPMAAQRQLDRTRRKSQAQGKSFHLAGRLVANGLIAFIVAAIAFVPLTALIKNFGPEIGISTAKQGAAALVVAAAIFICVAGVLMGRVYRAYQIVLAETAPESMSRRAASVTPERAQPIRRARSQPRDMPHDALPPEQEDILAPPMEEEAPVIKHEEPKKETFDENARRAVLEFLALALAFVKDEVPRMNQHVTFGLNLFGSGAAEYYGEKSGLTRMQSFVLVREVVSALGNTADRVDAFCRQYMEYAAEERYRMMIDAGKTVMRKRIEGHPEPFVDFRDALEYWTSDTAARAQSQGIVCIMFTDIVGSTAMTHERGDYAAQEVVRVHNAIVRSALAANHGREVKHTGDGIMASFQMAAHAVRATMEIRDTLAQHNAQQNAVPVNVRIGLNAGDAVQEEDDFFGTTVQLAARVCDKAGTGEIFVTDNVRELSKGTGIPFEEAGRFEMKGVPVPLTLYRVGARVAADQ